MRTHRELLLKFGFECVFKPDHVVNLNRPHFIEQAALSQNHSAGEGVTAVLTDGTGWSRWTDLSFRERLFLRLCGFKDKTTATMIHLLPHH